MHIDFVEIANFRKLCSTRIGFSKDKTVFVGANNSGKTSAMIALRYFLVEREQSSFSLNDFTLSHWPIINTMGKSWEDAKSIDQLLPVPAWESVLPTLDVWLHVEDNEVYYVQKILPTLDWEGGLLGVRLRFEPKDDQELQKEYLAARAEVTQLNEARNGQDSFTVTIWPQDLTDFLRRRLKNLFCIRAYVLNPDACTDPVGGMAQPQPFIAGGQPIDGNPFKDLIRIDEISAQRGFSDINYSRNEDDDYGGASVASNTRKLSEQLRRYYNRHLDPSKQPNDQDLQALKAIENAQKAFDARLKDGFQAAFEEMESLGYPGITDPKLNISTRLRPIDGMNHDAAVQYAVRMSGENTTELHLPEDSNGLGYQNLIYMVFRLMSSRDGWMQVGKANSKVSSSEEAFIPPLHLVLIEEPEAYLHTQVQQVFIRKAYGVLRNHTALKDKTELTTQLVVSTHSSHIAHECEFAALRYFRRIPAADGDIPKSCVLNLADVFGGDDVTERFVTRYLKITHCDLFFADAAVLIEGPAERILVPHFLRHNDEFRVLSECYITWLEIGGSHAHRLRNLIEHLELTTLIITDLDAVDEEGKSTTPKRSCKQKSRNETLKSWCPASDELDVLFDIPKEKMVKEYQGASFAVRVAYQCPVKIDFIQKSVEALANTLEDALLFENIELFKSLTGKGLIAKFKKALESSANISELSERLLDSLKRGDKAELALDLLEIPDPKKLKPPTYIFEGLQWLVSQLSRQQKELGLPITELTPASNERMG